MKLPTQVLGLPARVLGHLASSTIAGIGFAAGARLLEGAVPGEPGQAPQAQPQPRERNVPPALEGLSPPRARPGDQ